MSDRLKLYHYTTPEAAENIVAKNELWLSDVNSLDDGDEIRKRFHVFREQIISSEGFRNLNIFNQKFFLKYFIESLLDDELFIACFCVKNNNKHLWEHYAGKYTGYCLEFEITMPNGIHRNFLLQSMPMDYRDTNKCTDLQRLLDSLVFPNFREISEECRKLRRGHWKKVLLKHPGYIECRDIVIRQYLVYCLGSKSKEFEREFEWRLIASRNQSTWYDESKISYENGKRIMKFPIPDGFFTGTVYQVENVTDSKLK